MYMVSMMTYFFSVRGFGHPVFLKPHFGHPVMKILAKTLTVRDKGIQNAYLKYHDLEYHDLQNALA